MPFGISLSYLPGYFGADDPSVYIDSFSLSGVLHLTYWYDILIVPGPC